MAGLLTRAGFTLQRTRKTRKGADDPDRDAQFRPISHLAGEYLARGDPVVSVATKKKENLGDFANGGRERQPKGRPEPVRTDDFLDATIEKAIPYGIYDLASNEGFVSVSVTHDTPEFAVAALRRWWAEIGHPTYPRAKRLLITADCGGSNGHRVRPWNQKLSERAAMGWERSATDSLTGEEVTCPHCGSRLRLIATLHDPAVIRTILAHLGRSQSEQSPGPAPPAP